jgi:hypothetical protein
MSLVRYPIAASAEEALASALGHAEREREAQRLVGKPVAFVSQDMGPEFDSRDAAVEAWRDQLTDLAPEEMWRKVRETVAPISSRMPGPKQLTPTYEGGKRWPAPPPRPKTIWRLNITFWRPIVVQTEAPAPLIAPQTGPQARKLRRDPEAERLDSASLRALAEQPLRPQRLQKGLDIGLFEIRAPEDPNRLIADE